MPKPTNDDIRRIFTKPPTVSEQIADERAVRILELRAQGTRDWRIIANRVGISIDKAQKLWREELKRHALERHDLANAETAEMLAGLDADLASITDLISQADELDVGQRIYALAKLYEQKRKIEDRKSKLLALDAPERHAVLVAQVDGPSDAELEAMSVEEIEAQLKSQRKMREMAASSVVIDVEPLTPEEDDSGNVATPPTNDSEAVVARNETPGTADPEA